MPIRDISTADWSAMGARHDDDATMAGTGCGGGDDDAGGRAAGRRTDEDPTGPMAAQEVGVTGARSLCVADPAMVLQIGHGDARCDRTVIDSGPTALTVHYSCPGAGHGRSTITLRGGGGAFRLQTQGLAGGAPFDFDFDAKRTGDCAAPATPSGVR